MKEDNNHNFNILGLLANRAAGLSSEAYQAILEGSQETAGLIAEPAQVEHTGFRKLLEQETDRAVAELDRWQGLGIGAVGYGHPDYPERLLEIPDPPKIIFYRGRIQTAKQRPHWLAVVGSRKADPETCRFASALCERVASRGVVIVSGLALGLDGAAHQGALAGQSEFPTVAVLGNGLPNIYPTRHEKLADRIVQSGGVIISQFEPGERPYPSNFLNRNRLIAGLSQAVLVVQAGARSGSLVTARNALEQGREVLVTPGDVQDQRYAGSHQLIKQGAFLVTCEEDLLEMFGIQNYALEAKQPAETKHPLIDAIQSGTTLIEDLRHQTELGTEFDAEVLKLEIAGRLRRLPGMRLGLV